MGCTNKKSVKGDTMTDEASWRLGNKQAWRSMLATVLKGLGYNDPAVQQASWIIEREDAIITLRSVRDDFGDNDWADDLSLSDVIDKHLARYLHQD